MAVELFSALRPAVVAAFPGSPGKGDCVVLAGDGHLYTYNGATWVDNGASGGGGALTRGSVTLDFGASGGYATASIAHAPATAGDVVTVHLAGSTVDHSEEEHAIEEIDVRAAIYPGVGYAIFGSVRQGTTHGTFNVNWTVV